MPAWVSLYPRTACGICNVSTPPASVPWILARGGLTGPEKNRSFAGKSRVTVPPLMVPVNGVLREDTRRSGGFGAHATYAVNVPCSCPDEAACHWTSTTLDSEVAMYLARPPDPPHPAATMVSAAAIQAPRVHRECSRTARPRSCGFPAIRASSEPASATPC